MLRHQWQRAVVASVVTLSLATYAAAQRSPSTPAVPSTTLPSPGAISGTMPSAASALPGAGAGVASRPRGGFLQSLAAHDAALKASLRASPVCQLLGNMLKPLSGLTGGLIPAEKAPSAEEMAAPGPAGAAAKIKKDQLDAPKRVKAVQELGNVDCQRYPEAEQHLIAALRTDAIECVRLEAARALSKCNCCSKTVLEALRITVAGSEKDGNPAERSPRVRQQARTALENCLVTHGDDTMPLEPLPRPEQPLRPEVPVAYLRAKSQDRATTEPFEFAYYRSLTDVSMRAVRQQAARTVQQFKSRELEAKQTGRRSLSGIWDRSGSERSPVTISIRDPRPPTYLR